MNGEAFLGPLPAPWIIRNEPAGAYDMPHYLNTDTKTICTDDPRLGPLPSEWEPLDRDRTPDDPLHYAWFKNKVTGEEMNSDPRLLPEALEKRGVELQTFRLV